MFADYHLHTQFSDDSTEPMENQVKRAIELGLDEICFTDHVDYGIKRDFDDPRGIVSRIIVEHGKEMKSFMTNVNYPEYFKEIKRLQEKYPNLTIKQGLEFGIQSHTVPAYEKLYDKYKENLDFVLFSMHQVHDLELWDQSFQKGKTQQKYNEQYYDEIYKTMKIFKNYSCLAHLDVLVRYDLNGIYPFEKVEEKIAEILKLAIADGKGIVNNTCGNKFFIIIKKDDITFFNFLPKRAVFYFWLYAPNREFPVPKIFLQAFSTVCL